MDDDENNKADKQINKTIPTYAAVGIGIVCILFGLPLWWKTTTVYRVSLPYNEINAFSDVRIDCVINLRIVSMDIEIDLHSLKQSVITQINNPSSESRNISISYNVTVEYCSKVEQMHYNESSAISDLDTRLYKLQSKNDVGLFVVYLLPRNSHIKLHSLHSAYLGIGRIAVMWLNDNITHTTNNVVKLLTDTVTQEMRLKATVHSAWHTRKQLLDKETMRSVEYHQGYDVTFTIVNSEPDKQTVSWDIATAADKYFSSFIKKTKDYSTIQIKSQTLYYVGLSVQPRKATIGDYYYLTPDDLPRIVNSIEGYLTSHVSTNPQLNFIVYVVSSEYYPLRIVDQKGDFVESNAFLCPRWGGILFYNPPADSVNNFSVNMKGVMEVFASQLRLLLGFQHHVANEEIRVAQPGYALVNNWELDQWLRLKCVENTALAVTILESLSKLLGEIPNIVINDDIGREVYTAVHRIQKSIEYLGQAKLREAFLSSRQAIWSSEKAFFDPSLLELLYFPEDQKFAIYIPLFLPIGVPIIMSLGQAVKWFKSRQKLKSKTD